MLPLPPPLHCSLEADATRGGQAFFDDVPKTRALFAEAFGRQPFADPIAVMYHALTALSLGEKRAVVAREPDGREYGPAIVRCHKAHGGIDLHFDSSKWREQRTEMAVAQFETQLGAILVLQAPEKLGPTPGDEYSDNVMYNIDGRELGESIALSEEPRTSSTARDFGGVKQAQQAGAQASQLNKVDLGAFDRYCEARGSRRSPLSLDTGDLYVFKSDDVHTVPGFAGDRLRVVLAAFVGFSAAREEMFVWS